MSTQDLVLTNQPWKFTEADFIVYVSGGVYYALNMSNGVTTSNASFSTLWAVVLAALPTNGGSVYLRSGTYSVDAHIHNTKNLILRGAGMRATSLVAGAALNDSMIYHDGAATEPLLFVSDLTIDGDRGTGQVTAGYGVWASASAVFQRVEVKDTWGTGLLFRPNTASAFALTNAIVEDSYITNTGSTGSVGPGIRCGNGSGVLDIQHAVFRNNYFYNCEEHAIKIYAGSVWHSVIDGNTINTCDGAGISSSAVSYAKVVNNNVYNANADARGSPGIVIEDGGRFVVSGNTVDTVGANGIGIRIQGSPVVDSATICDNIVNSANYGIYMTGGTLTEGKVMGNYIRNTGSDGIYLNNSGRVSIMNNTLDTIHLAGMNLLTITGGQVSGNILTGCAGGNHGTALTESGIHLTACTRLCLLGNYIVDTNTFMDYGIYEAAGCDYNMILGNNIVAVAAPITTVGVNTINQHNIIA